MFAFYFALLYIITNEKWDFEILFSPSQDHWSSHFFKNHKYNKITILRINNHKTDSHVVVIFIHWPRVLKCCQAIAITANSYDTSPFHHVLM